MPSVDVQEYFKELGEYVEKRWRAVNYNEENFNQIAEEALLHFTTVDSVSYLDVLQYVILNTSLDVCQIKCKFSDLQWTLYQHQKFYIEALYWMDGTTAIHQHGFSGAFSLLHGRSIHTEYDFHSKKRFNAFFYIGDLKVSKTSILHTGDVKKITAGKSFIHSVFHLDSPSVTLVIRNNTSIEHHPQLGYYAPYVAFNAKDQQIALYRKIKSIQLMLNHQKEEGYRLLHQFVMQCSFYELYVLFSEISFFDFDLTQRGLLSTHICKMPYGNELLATLENQYQARRLNSLRGFIKDEEQRIFLAVLRNTPGKQNILKHLGELFQCETNDRLINVLTGFIEKISRIGGVGFKSCNQLNALVNILARDETDAEIERKISQLGKEALHCYQGLKESFVLRNWFQAY
ncbi:MAG: hypothetical protein H2069_06100 [Legionella sp.]|nr:hypothetical protein [Legionella sp.]